MMKFNHIRFILRALLVLASLGITFQARVTFASGCATADCHTELAAKPQLHSIETTSECTLCHERQTDQQHPSNGKADFALVTEGSQLCFQCHDTFNGKPYKHMPAEGGECSVCHEPHGRNGEQPSRSGADLTALCTSCHESFDQPHLHGPVAIGACTTCHDPHAAEQEALLKKQPRDLCLGCHAGFAEGMASSPVIHEPVAEQSCTACHDPHHSPNPNLLAQQMPDICFDCHDDMAEKLKTTRTKHPVLSGESSCGTCHSTHFSPSPGLLGQNQQDLCLSCHGKDNYKKSDALKNIATELNSRNFLHGPLENGECGACHDPHGSDNFRMLRERYPKEFYAPYEDGTYALCLSCHDSYLLKFKDTSIYTKFRNGELNLHYVHVNKARKGRTCRACHEPHASNQFKMISSKGSDFGDWNIPNQFQKSETGGACMPGCHRQLAYDRDNPVEYGQQ